MDFDENSKSLQELMDYHSKKIERNLSIGTIRNFSITEGYINKFLSKERNTTDLYLRELDYKFLCDFESFLQRYWPKSHLLCGIKKNLTFHMARHTFATTITLSNGVPIETVSKLLGHTKITTTQIYARVLEKKVSEDMDALRKVLEFKREKNEDRQRQK